MVLMIMSGWQIYNASPLFELHILQFDHARRLARRRAALALCGDVAADAQRSALSGAGFRHRPLSQEASADHAGGRAHDTKAALTGKLSHDDLSKYNYVQKLLYAGVIVIGVLIVLSGLSIWKPVQLQ